MTYRAGQVLVTTNFLFEEPTCTITSSIWDSSSVVEQESLSITEKEPVKTHLLQSASNAQVAGSSPACLSKQAKWDLLQNFRT